MLNLHLDDHTYIGKGVANSDLFLSIDSSGCFLFFFKINKYINISFLIIIINYLSLTVIIFIFELKVIGRLFTNLS